MIWLTHSRMWLILLLVAVMPLPAMVGAQDDATGTVIVTALDCRGADVYAPSTCSPTAGVPFNMRDSSTNPPTFSFYRTGEDGTFTLELTVEYVFVLEYSTEIAWSDEPVASLTRGDAVGLLPGEVLELTYLLVDPGLTTAGDASFEIIVRDCSAGDQDDLSTCEPMPGLSLVLDYRGLNGRSTELLYTDPDDGSFYGFPYGVPAIFTARVDIEDNADLGLIALDPHQQVVALAGDAATITFIFVDEGEDPVTELPDTGTGIGQESTDWVARLLLSGVLTGFVGVVLRRRVNVLTY